MASKYHELWVKRLQEKVGEGVLTHTVTQTGSSPETRGAIVTLSPVGCTAQVILVEFFPDQTITVTLRDKLLRISRRVTFSDLGGVLYDDVSVSYQLVAALLTDPKKRRQLLAVDQQISELAKTLREKFAAKEVLDFGFTILGNQVDVRIVPRNWTGEFVGLEWGPEDVTIQIYDSPQHVAHSITVNPTALRRMSTSVKSVVCKIISMTWRDAIRYIELVDTAV